jgi:hypothetical protein
VLDPPKNESGVKVKSPFDVELHDCLDSSPCRNQTIISVGTGSPGAVTSVVSLVVSRGRTIGFGEIGGNWATGKSGGGRSIRREDGTARVDRASGDWPTWTTWDRGKNSGVGNWSLTADADESGTRLSGNDGWDLRLRSISGSWTIWDRTGGRRAARLREPGRDLSVGRGEIGGGRTGGNSGIRVDWVVAASGVGVGVGSVGFIVGNRNIRGRTGGLWKISWRWAAGLREPGGNGSTRRGEIGGGRTGGNRRLGWGCVIAATVTRVDVVRLIRNVWDRASGPGESGWWWTTGIGESSGRRSIWRGDRAIRPRNIGGDRPARNSQSSWDRSVLVGDGRDGH